MIEYKNISEKEYNKLSDEEKKEKPYCIEFPNGNIIWNVYEKFHNEDGPAIIFNGNYFWFLNDERYLFEEWCKILNKSDEEIIFLKLKYS